MAPGRATCDNRAVTTRRWASLLFAIGLLFAEGFAVAPARPANSLSVAITIVCADSADEVQPAARPTATFPARAAIRSYEAPAPVTAPAFALFQRPPPHAA